MFNATGPDSNRNAPPGAVPDFDHPEDVFYTLNVAMVSICVSFVIVFYGIRLYVKRTITHKLLTEDCKCCHHDIDVANHCRDM